MQRGDDGKERSPGAVISSGVTLKRFSQSRQRGLSRAPLRLFRAGFGRRPRLPPPRLPASPVPGADPKEAPGEGQEASAAAGGLSSAGRRAGWTLTRPGGSTRRVRDLAGRSGTGRGGGFSPPGRWQALGRLQGPGSTRRARVTLRERAAGGAEGGADPAAASRRCPWPRRAPERAPAARVPGRREPGGRKMAAASRVFAFRDARWAPDPVLEPSAAVRTPQPVPLVIDNGSFQTRAGWASADPAVPAEPLLRFRSLAARSRGARGGAGAETQVGNDLGSPEPLRWLLRSPFDRNVPVQLELQELLLDHVFQRLGVASQVPPGGGRRAGGRP